nr:BTB/POZ domain-containing protein 19 isoform X2 [Chrysemys picta bellii]
MPRSRGPPQTPLVLSHVQPEVFLAVLEFLYTNSVTLNSFVALEVLTSAVEYGLDDLRKSSKRSRVPRRDLSGARRRPWAAQKVQRL